MAAIMFHLYEQSGKGGPRGENAVQYMTTTTREGQPE